MEQFRLRPEGFKEIRNKTLFRYIIAMGLAAIIGASIYLIGFKDMGAADIDTDFLSIFIPVFVVLMGFRIYRILSRQKALFDTYVLTFSDNLITREQANTPVLSLHSFEIKEIIKDKVGHFWIKANDVIIVPVQIERYEEVEVLLNKIVPVTTKMSFKYKYRNVISIVSLALMFCVYLTTNKLIIGISGPLLAGILIWNLIDRWKLRNSLDKSTQRSFFIQVIVLIVAIAITVMKLMGYDYLS
ncbi:hypothetical protein SAMN05428988_4361 [Chitinophaga sp. YR573]|uniref:hypothetical protein n=1 Tax=Chitinophaga sp. YR573 TaxID=1881040 RepID=UPI0008CEC16A|nr:hypothetical protein [Chitinophaga sp. YR573]SEW35607.1 hypothetical protein SAMN05428988_4361 [Chitinophaga sp. YR573]